MRGAYYEAARAITEQRELSPRIWGVPENLNAYVRGVGVIPTVVGLPITATINTAPARAIPTPVGLTLISGQPCIATGSYPHVCGAYDCGDVLVALPGELSPRVWGLRGETRLPKGGAELSPRAWGLRGRFFRNSAPAGAIPTCVGRTSSRAPRSVLGQSYPHVRGAYVTGYSAPAIMLELSPRAWGVRTAHEWTEWGRGAIPTCVRLTSRTLLIVSAGWSYPHVRGAYWGTEPSEHSARESSPRAWGLHTRRASATVFARVIPTCVGLTLVHLR